MAENGENRYLLTYSTKSALKSPVGKKDSSTKSKKGKKVKFDPEDSLGNNAPVSNGKISTPAAKGGKEEKTANGLKILEGKAPAPEKRRLEQELPEHTTCLMDCEAAEFLLGIQDQMAFLSQDPDIILPASFVFGLTYAKRAGNYAKPQTIKRIFEPLKKHGVSDSEICMIVNICPESVDEVVALVPGMKAKIDRIREPLRIALEELANLRLALANLSVDCNGSAESCGRNPAAF